MSKKSQKNKTNEKAFPDYKNPGLPIKKRVKDLVSRMTLDEKVAQMVGIWNLKKTILMDEEGNIKLDNLQKDLKHGLGQIGRLSDTAGGQKPEAMAELGNTIQKYFVEKTRLGIPVIFHEECLHGLAGPEATSYPQPIGMASTFNPELVEKVYSSIAEDARSRGAHQALTPVVDVARDPRWGRVEETFGEDPYLVAQLGIAAVKGFQGDGTYKDKKHVIATLKHFAAHGQPESGSNCGPVNVSERLLRDTFLQPFKEVIEKANAMSVMASYNEIDGVPSHANKWLLRDVLRREWGFKGFVVSDYFALTELNVKPDTLSHAVAKDKKESALLAALAGVNIELPDFDCYPYLKELVKKKKLDVAVVDELVSTLLHYKFLLGLFDDPYVNVEEVNDKQKLDNDRTLALKAAHETMVLLKNENKLLPLNKNKKQTIAVIGPNADRMLLGGYSGTPVYFTTVLEGIKNKVGENAEVLYSEGCKITIGGSWNEDVVTPSDPEEDKRLISEAVEVAKKADTIILAIGGNEQTSREAWAKVHLGDRASLDMVGRQNDLVKALLELGKPVVAVLFNGRPLSINYLQVNVSAILECWYLGQECGTAVADVLFGDYNPGGKLPISFPRSAGHIPCFYNRKPSARRGYLFDDILPLYTFGFGLSYSSFELSNMRLDKTKIKMGKSTQVHIDVKNTSQISGDEVVQLYIHDLFSSVTRPVKELRGFRRINLKPGETKTVTFTIAPEHLEFTKLDMQRGVEPGDFEIMIGTSSRDEDLSKLSLTVV